MATLRANKKQVADQLMGQAKKLLRMKSRITIQREAKTLAFLMAHLPADHDSAGRGPSAALVRSTLDFLPKPYRRPVRQALAAMNRRELASVR